MRGPKPSYAISLTEAEVKSLQQQVRAHKTGQSQAMRAQILLSAHEHPEWSNQQIAEVAGTSDRIVRKWRGRWVGTRSIADAPRSGAPRRFSPCNACTSDSHGRSLPSERRVSLARWSHRAIARQVAATVADQAPSSRTVGRWLKAERLRPWRYHNWQHIQDPERFLRRARPVLQLYMQALSLLHEGIWLLCVDEKTRVLRA